MKEIKLYEYEADTGKKIPLSSSHIVLVRKEDEGYKINLGASIITVRGSNIKNRRAEIQNGDLVADFYVDIDEVKKELRDNLRSYATVFTETTPGVFKVSSKNYFVIRHIDEDEIKKLSIEELKNLGLVMQNARCVYTTESPIKITRTEPSEPSHKGYLISRSALDHLSDDRLDSEVLKEHIDVYHEDLNGITKTTLEDVLDSPKEFVPPVANEKKYYYDYNPTELESIPKSILGGEVVEFERTGFTKEGIQKWKQSRKIIQNQHAAEFLQDLLYKGNRAFIEIPDIRSIPVEELKSMVDERNITIGRFAEQRDETKFYTLSNMTMEEVNTLPVKADDTYVIPNSKLFFEYDPLATDLIPNVLLDGNYVEFEQVDYNEKGLPIWKESHKIIQNQHKEEYSEDLKKTGNRAFIEVVFPSDPRLTTKKSAYTKKDIKAIAKIEELEKLVELGLIQEFDLLETKNGLNYYVSKEYHNSKEEKEHKN